MSEQRTIITKGDYAICAPGQLEYFLYEIRGIGAKLAVRLAAHLRPELAAAWAAGYAEGLLQNEASSNPWEENHG